MHANAVTGALFSIWSCSSVIRKFEGHLAFVTVSTHDHQADFSACGIRQAVQHCQPFIWDLPSPYDVRHRLSCGVRQAVQHCQPFIWDLPSPYDVNPF